MALSFNTFEATQTPRAVFDFTLAGPYPGYLNKTDIRVYTRGNSTEEWYPASSFTVTGTRVRLDYSTTEQVLIARETNKHSLSTNWKQSTRVTPENLYLGFLQQLYLAQEAFDVLEAKQAVRLHGDGPVSFEITSDTSLTVKVLGSDGITRSGEITLS